MKKFMLLLILASFYSLSNAQKMKDGDLEKRIALIEDRIAIKNLVDTFSVLADVKDIDKQVLLFTENGTVESMRNGQPGNALVGRKAIGDAFRSFLSLFEVVYHTNGQQIVAINGDKASGISYCLVTLIGIENGKKMNTTMGVYYHDEYVKQSGRWFIAKRQSTFAWTDKHELGQ